MCTSIGHDSVPYCYWDARPVRGRFLAKVSFSTRLYLGTRHSRGRARSRLGVHGSRSGSGFSGARASRSRSARAELAATPAPWLAPGRGPLLRAPLAPLSLLSHLRSLCLSLSCCSHALSRLSSFPFHTTRAIARKKYIDCRTLTELTEKN